MPYEWVFSYNTDPYSQKQILTGEEVFEHPLRSLVTLITESRVGHRNQKSSSSSTSCSTPPNLSSDFLDPLSSAFDGHDPLSRFIDPLTKIASEPVDLKEDEEGYFESWSSRRTAILSKYSTSEKLSLVLASGEKVVLKTQTSVVEKVKTRLEQLDDLDEGVERQTVKLSQQEYVSRIALMNQEMIDAWHQDQRVRALKIVIQVSKMLGDVSVMHFYPSKFVLISDIFDVFGKLVFDRLRAKSEHLRPGSKAAILPENFTVDMVSENAKETCRNWFYKIASIRELIPRLYCEMAILKSYSFISTGDILEAIGRLTKMIRGIANPLVAIYARCYLCRIGLSLCKERQFLKENFYELLLSYRQLESRSVCTELARQNIPAANYQNLFLPALDFILQAASCQPSSEGFLDDALNRIKVIGNPLLIYSLLRGFPKKVIAQRALIFVELIHEVKVEGIRQYELFQMLGTCLNEAKLSADKSSAVFDLAWQSICEIKDFSEYLSVCETWSHFVAASLTTKELNMVLENTFQKLQQINNKDDYLSKLYCILSAIVLNFNEEEDIFVVEKFLPLVYFFGQDPLKIELCRIIMVRFSKKQTSILYNPVLTNSLMYICKVLHDSVSAMSTADETRHLGNLIGNFIRFINFGRDFEQQLNFYVECRGAFPNLDQAHIALVEQAAAMTVAACRAVKGHHTRKTAAFVRACIAFCFISVPSIGSIPARLDLYLVVGQAALVNQCLGQADACFQAALSLLKTFGKEKNWEGYLIGYIKKFLSVLLVVPDNPEQGVMSLTKELINVVQNYQWDNRSSGKVLIYFKAIDMMHGAIQEHYPYHVTNVESNDSLYGWDPKFTNELNRMAGVLLQEILSHLKYLENEGLYKEQFNLSLELFIRIVTRADLDQPQMATLALNLWNLAQKHGCLDVNLAQRVKEYLHRRIDKDRSDNYSTLLSKLQLPK